MLRINRFWALLWCAALIMLTLSSAQPVLAVPSEVIFTVNSALDDLVDDNVGDGNCHTAANTCTLRAAVMEANRSSGVGVTITVPSGIYALTIPATPTDGPENGDLNLTNPSSGNPTISIVGAGAATTIIDANKIDRVFTIENLRTASISNVTIRNGYLSNSDGGGIANGGKLIVSRSTISGNDAASSGGGIHCTSDLSVVESTIGPDNVAYSGGGIWNHGAMTVRSSTIYRNRVQGDGGGLFTYGSALAPNSFLVNSTVSQNEANTSGGGIYNAMYGFHVYNSSILSNAADVDADPEGGLGGGIFNSDAGGAVSNLSNTLVAGNGWRDVPVFQDCAGTVHSYGGNVFSELDSYCNVFNNSGTWNLLNSLSTIAPLGDNGGPTWTAALLASSNAVDWGNPQGCINPDGTPLTTDQRGAPRPVGDRCDAGAFEFGAKLSQTITFGAPANKTLGDAPFAVSATSSSGLAVTFTAAGPCGVSGTTVTLTGAGTCTLTAHQAGNANYTAAADVSQSFTITGIKAVPNKAYLPLLTR